MVASRLFGGYDTPREVLNWRLWYAVLVFGVLGTARGLDEGNVSGMISQISFINEFGLDDPTRSTTYLANLESNITSMVQIGCVGGALLAFFVADRIGRVRSVQQLCLVWILGVVIQMTSHGNVGQLYAGRFISGLGIGQTTVVGPTYLAEVAPRSIRGMCSSFFAGAVYLGVMLSYFANWGTTLHIANNDRRQWVIPTSVQLMFAGIILIGSLFSIESPRWYMKVGKEEEAADALSKIRNLPTDHYYLFNEIRDIKEQLEREKEASIGTHPIWGRLHELWLPSNRYRLFIGIMAQFLSQWSGANAITIYAPTFFKLVGISGQDEKLFATAILGVVKLVASMICALFLIDFIGRKRAVTIGICGQFLSILYVGVYLAIEPVATGTVKHISLSNSRAHKAAIAMIYLNGASWCLGWNSIQYLINAEIFPLQLRNLGSSIVQCFHFANQYANSKALPSMLLAMDNWGAMVFFAAVCLLGLAWIWLFLPETAGRSLESMDALFSLPWYLIGIKGNRMAPDEPVGESRAKHDMEKAEVVEDVKEEGRLR